MQPKSEIEKKLREIQKTNFHPSFQMHWNGFIKALSWVLSEPDKKVDTCEQVAPDLSTCPTCGGPADNGNDRCYPPNPYECTSCSELEETK